jgi:uncharacterized protein (TIGR02996 family)
VPPASSLDATDPPVLRCFLDSIVEAGSDCSPRLILADWLEEHDRENEAELLRLQTALIGTCCQPDRHPERVQQQARLVELLAAGVRPCLPRRTVALAKGVDMTFAWIPPGTFLMGSPPSEQNRYKNESQHKVTLTKGFYLGVHEVTQAQWQAMIGDNTSFFKGDNLPVETVSWEDCQAFCEKLSQLDGKHYGLPTEAEWEYACRAGTTTAYFFGDDPSHLGDYGWFYDNAERKTHDVGTKIPNAWGLFDMHGNVWEWCQDWYGPHGKKHLRDPQGSNNEEARVVRGGSWYGLMEDCRAAFRFRYAPGNRIYNFGLRVCFRLD